MYTLKSKWLTAHLGVQGQTLLAIVDLIGLETVSTIIYKTKINSGSLVIHKIIWLKELRAEESKVDPLEMVKIQL